MAEAVATGLAGAGIAQSIQNVLGTVSGYVKEIIVQVARFGRQVIRISYEIAKELARPEIGVPFAILVYNASKLIRIDKTGVISAINSYFESMKTLNPIDIAWSYIRSGLSRVIDVSKVNSFWDLLNPFIAWDAINSSPIAPRLEVNIFGYTIDIGVIPRIFMFMAWYPVFITMSIPLAFQSIIWNIILAIIDIQKNVITSIVGFIIDLLGWIGNVLSWLACTYLKIVQPIIPLYFGAKNIGRGFRRAITSAIGGTLFTWIMMYAFASECVSISMPAFPTPTPVTPIPTTPSPAIPSMEYTVIRSIKPLVSTTSLPPVEIRIDKSLKIQFFWSRVGVAEYAIDKVLRPLVEITTITLLEKTIDKTLKPSVEYTIIEPARVTIDRTVKPEIEVEAVPFTEVTIDKTVKPEIETAVMIQELVIDRILKPLIEYTAVEVIEVTVDKIVKPIIEYTVIPIIEAYIDKVMKSEIATSVEVLQELSVEKVIKPETVIETVIEAVQELIVDRLLKPYITYEVLEIQLLLQSTYLSIDTYVKQSDILITWYAVPIPFYAYVKQLDALIDMQLAQFIIEITTG